jgi:hypothetical protein
MGEVAMTTYNAIEINGKSLPQRACRSFEMFVAPPLNTFSAHERNFSFLVQSVLK